MVLVVTFDSLIEQRGSRTRPARMEDANRFNIAGKGSLENSSLFSKFLDSNNCASQGSELKSLFPSVFCVFLLDLNL